MCSVRRVQALRVFFLVGFATCLPQPIFAASPVCVSRQELTARSMGIVNQYLVSDGQKVKKGEALIELDNRLLKAGAKEAAGAKDAAKANEDLAADAFRRLEQLKKSDTVTDQQVVEAKIRVAQAKAVRRQAEGAAERVETQLQDTIMRAEIDGIVSGLPSILGLFVQVGQSLGRIEVYAKSCAKAPKN